MQEDPPEEEMAEENSDVINDTPRSTAFLSRADSLAHACALSPRADMRLRVHKI